MWFSIRTEALTFPLKVLGCAGSSARAVAEGACGAVGFASLWSRDVVNAGVRASWNAFVRPPFSVLHVTATIGAEAMKGALRPLTFAFGSIVRRGRRPRADGERVGAQEVVGVDEGFDEGVARMNAGNVTPAESRNDRDLGFDALANDVGLDFVPAKATYAPSMETAAVSAAASDRGAPTASGSLATKTIRETNQISGSNASSHNSNSSMIKRSDSANHVVDLINYFEEVSTVGGGASPSEAGEAASADEVAVPVRLAKDAYRLSPRQMTQESDDGDVAVQLVRAETDIDVPKSPKEEAAVQEDRCHDESDCYSSIAEASGIASVADDVDVKDIISALQSPTLAVLNSKADATFDDEYVFVDDHRDVPASPMWSDVVKHGLAEVPKARDTTTEDSMTPPSMNNYFLP